jgi:hypothetical protein
MAISSAARVNPATTAVTRSEQAAILRRSASGPQRLMATARSLAAPSTPPPRKCASQEKPPYVREKDFLRARRATAQPPGLFLGRAEASSSRFLRQVMIVQTPSW